MTGENRKGREEGGRANEPTSYKPKASLLFASRGYRWFVILLIALAYLSTLSPGHPIVDDDFAAYVLHARNLAEGRPYTEINYISNPKTSHVAPSNGYPPVYPLILVVPYKIWGIDLRAFKATTVICFIVFLAVFVEFATRYLTLPMVLSTLLIIAFNPVFWHQRNLILSEFPYLMFSFVALLIIQRTYKKLSLGEWRFGTAIWLSFLMYGAYGTRTIGIVLLPALALADLTKFKRPSRFLILVCSCTTFLILAQAALITWPKSYLRAVQFSPHLIATNALFYSKTLSYVWGNGFSKQVQIGFALLFTGLAAFGFIKNFWKEHSATEFYLLGYLAVLFVWSAEFGLRGLLPILPFYFVYAFEQFSHGVMKLSVKARSVVTAVFLIFIVLLYSGEFIQESRWPPQANVLDPCFHQLVAFLKLHTGPTDVLVFPKPRTLALYSGRRVAALAPDETPGDTSYFLKQIHATFFVNMVSSPPAWQKYLANNKGRTQEIFENSRYEVFRIPPP